jgi:hypothetical protein
MRVAYVLLGWMKLAEVGVSAHFQIDESDTGLKSGISRVLLLS